MKKSASCVPMCPCYVFTLPYLLWNFSPFMSLRLTSASGFKLGISRQLFIMQLYGIIICQKRMGDTKLRSHQASDPVVLGEQNHATPQKTLRTSRAINAAVVFSDKTREVAGIVFPSYLACLESCFIFAMLNVYF